MGFLSIFFLFSLLSLSLSSTSLPSPQPLPCTPQIPSSLEEESTSSSVVAAQPKETAAPMKRTRFYNNKGNYTMNSPRNVAVAYYSIVFFSSFICCFIFYAYVRKRWRTAEENAIAEKQKEDERKETEEKKEENISSEDSKVTKKKGKEIQRGIQETLPEQLSRQIAEASVKGDIVVLSKISKEIMEIIEDNLVFYSLQKESLTAIERICIQERKEKEKRESGELGEEAFWSMGRD